MSHLSLSNIKPEAYRHWLSQPSTQRLLALEASWLGSWVKQLYGCHLAYTGIDNDPRFLRHSRIQHRITLALPWSQGVVPSNAFIRDDAWPFADESLDVVIMQHSLDMSRQPHQLLREACRCLVPNGYVVIIGFNPVGAWGGWRWLRSFSARLPWITRPLSSHRLQDWLTLLDLKVEQVFHCAHLWPVSLGSENLNRRIDRVIAGTAWLPSNVYLMVARKTVAGMTPIRMQKRFYKSINFGLSAAAASSMLQE